MFIGRRETESICTSVLPKSRKGSDGDFGDDPRARSIRANS
jgi:hypothetical protein